MLFMTRPTVARLHQLCIALVLICSCSLSVAAQTPAASGLSAKHAQVHKLKVTILSTMLADEGIGEWGFSTLVEADGHRVLVDTGFHPETVLQNATKLG